MTHRLRLIVFACAPMWIGCATVLHGTTQQIRFESIPTEATAHVGTQMVTTPGELTLSRKTAYEVEFEKPGYVPAHSHIGQASSGAVWGNLLLGGLIGIIVDASNGAAYELDPSTVSVTLLPEPSAEGNVADTNAPQVMPAAIPEQPPELPKPMRSVEEP